MGTSLEKKIEIVEQYLDSNQGQTAFAKSVGMSQNTLRSWVYSEKVRSVLGHRYKQHCQKSAKVQQVLEIVPMSEDELPSRACGLGGSKSTLLRKGDVELSFSQLPSAQFLAEILRYL